jgi:hypothetical protein
MKRNSLTKADKITNKVIASTRALNENVVRLVKRDLR